MVLQSPYLQIQARRSAEHALEQLKMDESKEMLREIQTISTHLITIPQSPRLADVSPSASHHCPAPLLPQLT